MKTKALVVGICATFILASADAMPIQALSEPSSLTIQVADGCGPGGWRGPWGACHHPHYFGGWNGCPPGYWHGPWGHCRDTPYHGRLPGGGWKP
jgi:hypothetical protein